eukprot:TRINITY_DN165_c0_g1_i1.p1 TRINITY_DN165_c0_g1~~TRINITY_DN165_c0_g1_i1.p1  ORF type:complete len:1096 (+),score=427.06 TRINITY_DN165_c0_g1_i1:121-3408(+)
MANPNEAYGSGNWNDPHQAPNRGKLWDSGRPLQSQLQDLNLRTNNSYQPPHDNRRSNLTRSSPTVHTFNPAERQDPNLYGNGPNMAPGAPYQDPRAHPDLLHRHMQQQFNSGSLNASPGTPFQGMQPSRMGLSQSHTGLAMPVMGGMPHMMGAIGSPLTGGGAGAHGHHTLTGSSGGLRNSNSGIMTGTSLRASGVHPIPVPVDATVPVESGIICLLKDNYGFVRCAEREEDIFFHCTSLIPPSPLSAEELQNFITSIRVGNEVQFHVINDVRTGKLSAVNLNLLPKGSVVFHDTIQERVRGIILKEVSEHGDENDIGVLAYRTADDIVEQLRFGPTDLDEPRVPLAPEDEVEFDIVFNRRLKGKCAAHVVLVRFGGDRQTGVIHSVKDGFGFIRCCDSPRSLYFHFRDVVLLQRGQEITKGTEVEYTVANDERAGKLCAVRVRGLPKGTVSFTVAHDERVRGIVQRELGPTLPVQVGSSSPFTRREDEEKGVITLVGDNTESLLFGLSDIRNPNAMNRSFPYLRYGDEIECTVLTDKRNGRKHATDVVLMNAAAEKIEMGVVCSVKKNYGHITCAEQDEDLFFHFTDFDDSALVEAVTNGEKEILPGTEVQFVIVPDSRTGKKKAAHIQVLNSGTVKFEDISESRVQGLVIRECKPGQTGYIGKRQPSDLGMIEYEGTDPKTQVKRNETVTFGCNDVRDTKVALWPGDVVAFNIATDKRTKSKSAVNVELVSPTQLPREVGVVSSVKNSFGFIKCPEREEEVYFHFSELDNVDSVVPGTELEFSVVKNSWFKKLLAIRIKTLNKGSVKFAPGKPNEVRYTGIVDRELKGRGREGFGGKISYKTDDSPAVEEGGIAGLTLIDFNGEDVDSRYALRRGDKVEFSIAEDARTKAMKATNIVPHTEVGVVSTVKENFGFIKLANSQDEIFFHQSEVGDSNPLHPGELVEFHTVLNPRTKALSAQGIRKSGGNLSFSSPNISTGRFNLQSSANSLNNSLGGGSASNSPQVNLRTSGNLKMSNDGIGKSRTRVQRGPNGSPDVFLLRQPTSADGGKGFQSAGRGKLLPKEREELVQQAMANINEQNAQGGAFNAAQSQQQ